MALPETISFVWASTAASIPANWERTTAFDGKHLYWTAADDAGTTGGAASHTHTFTSAAHSFSAGAGSGERRWDAIVGIKPTPSTVTHTHSAKNSATGSVTSGATNNEPSWISVIFINPADASQTGIPNNAWALSDDSVPTGWTEPSNADNKFTKGATAAGNSDLTGGGNTAHAHDISHSHTATASNGGTGNSSVPDATDNNEYAASTHTHLITFDSSTINCSSDANSSLPLYEKLLWIKNETGGADLQTGVIGFYLGLDADIAANWGRVDPTTGDFIMGATQASEIGDIGGAATHAHTGIAHTHTFSAALSNNNVGTWDGGTYGASASAGHTHTWTVANATDTVTVNSSKSHYPSWIKVILLKYTEPAAVSLRMLAATGVGV